MLIQSGQVFTGEIGVAFSAQIIGDASFFVLVQPSSGENYDTALPAGLTLSSSGLISGTPTANTYGGPNNGRLRLKILAYETQSGNIGAGTSQASTIDILIGATPLLSPNIVRSIQYGNQTQFGDLIRNLDFTFQDSVNRPVSSVAANGLPTGLSIRSVYSSYFSVGVSTTAALGDYPVSFTLTGPGGQSVGSAIISVTPGRPILPFQTGSFKYGEAGSYQIFVEESESRPVNSFAFNGLTPLPSWASFNASTGLITGTPNSLPSNLSRSYIVTATGPGGINEQDYDNNGYGDYRLTLQYSYGTPIITAGQSGAAKVGTAFSKIFSLTDSANRPVTSWAAAGLPSWASINSTTGAITGTPQDTGSVTVTLTATGPGGSHTETAEILISVGAPVIAAGQIFTGKVGEAFSQTIALDDALDRPATSFTRISTLPAGLTLNTGTGEVSGTPTAKGTLNVSIRATGPGGTGETASVSFTIAEGVPIFTYPADPLPLNAATSVQPNITDSSNRPITSWSATGLPPGLSIDATTGELVGAPTAEGDFTATITATGPGGASTQTISFAVVNTFPIFLGSTRVAAIYAGAAEAKAVFYGPQLLWNVAGWEPPPTAASFTGAAAGDEFGCSVAINSQGNRIAIGSRYNDAGGSNAGAVSVYDFSGGTWSQRGNDIIGASNSQLGSAVAMDSTGEIVAAITSSGKARVFEWSGNTWAQRGADILAASCFSVSLSSAGDVIAIGAPEGVNYSGYSEIYEWSGTAWALRGSRILSEVSGDRSGQSVSLSGNGTRIAIGARFSNSGGSSSGHARVFKWSGSAWTQVGASIPGAAAYDEAGYSVSLNSTGTRIAIGARYHDAPAGNAGHVRVFEEIDGAWVQMGQSMNGEAVNNWSGCSVSLNSTGDIIAIGAERNNADAGHVRIYQWNGTSWQQQGGDIDGETAGDKLGFSVALNGAGTLLIAGAPYSDALGTSTGSAKVIPLPAAP